MNKMDKATKQLIMAVVVFVMAMLALTWLALPYIRLLSEPETQQEFTDWVTSLGLWGGLVFLGIQILQVIVAFIPGEPVELLAGVLYGGWGGLLISLMGCMVASSFIFLLTKKWGVTLLTKLFPQKKIAKFAFLNNSRQLETVVFILFLLPGTPKDMLTYIVGTTPMRLSRFLFISTLARIPSIVSSTFIGATLWQGEWDVSLLFLAVTTLAGLAGIVYKDRLVAFCRKKGSRMKGAVLLKTKKQFKRPSRRTAEKTSFRRPRS
ncbi:VTT domain-containing protein [Desulforamulus ruminis]|uniref:TVP38/TMEM64 family membrane protein n=1 Tax=Desulforamulus ruminis (strain ATCC 23193 / DSM 2154 / NCIMB 8452 / DL) TaxID=696281 RepID=F6DK03_DESRL|nr:VTT domain-containing protein [Desulforamulus ruminis]AEG60317.1 SNARE associated Golgi protein-like protein [Desulforamulus ruminis DSM 2154]